MDFTPETRMVLNDLIRHGQPEVEAALLGLADRARTLVPELVGLSIGHTHSGTVFTLAASSIETAAIDAAQYIDGGPCVDASTNGSPQAWEAPGHPDDPMDEQRWATYARATAAAGVASSLSLPLTVKGRIVGGVNLYASTPDAFTGRHGQLAHALGADVTAAVANADLSFATRAQAQQAAEHFAEDNLVHQATGIISARHDIDMTTARNRLAASAERAGISDVQAAKALLATFLP